MQDEITRALMGWWRAHAWMVVECGLIVAGKLLCCNECHQHVPCCVVFAACRTGPAAAAAVSDGGGVTAR